MNKRIDILLTEKGLAKSRTSAQALIKEGSVTVNGKTVTRPSEIYDDNDKFEVADDSILTKYVGRGGLKLETAIEHFGISLNGTVCLDIGASTGGFTDCMLQYGACRVYAVDVGTSQLDEKMRSDSRVISLENLDIRDADNSVIPEKVNFISIDVSFISLKQILPVIGRFSSEKARCVALIKPQFELGKKKIGKKGVVTDKKIREKVINDIVSFTEDLGFEVIGTVCSAISGGDGNIEYLMYFIIP